jgi:hypothetical protein
MSSPGPEVKITRDFWGRRGLHQGTSVPRGMCQCLEAFVGATTKEQQSYDLSWVQTRDTILPP